LCFCELFIGEEDDGEQHVGEGCVMIFVAVFVAEFSIGAEELFENGKFYSFSHDVLVIDTYLEDLGVYFLVFSKLFDRLPCFTTATRQMLQIGLDVPHLFNFVVLRFDLRSNLLAFFQDLNHLFVVAQLIEDKGESNIAILMVFVDCNYLLVFDSCALPFDLLLQADAVVEFCEDEEARFADFFFLVFRLGLLDLLQTAKNSFFAFLDFSVFHL
jgi:hypothetical protein